jgi:aspartate-semialdehyde dehydrogenase
MKKIKVGVLGATGIVGQWFIHLLRDHPWFELTALAASEKSANRPYEEAVGDRWKIPFEMPDYAKAMKVRDCTPDLDCRLVFSGLDSSVAGPVETAFAEAGYVVSSNSKNHRMDAAVPLLVPEVNYDHLEVVKRQKTPGFIVTNPNCSAIPLALVLKPLLDSFGVAEVFVTTMQALSGAGFKGFELDIEDNILPHIGGEEPKVESEPLKILARVQNGEFVHAQINISAHCNRVNVRDGHLEAVSVRLDRKPTLEEFKNALSTFNPLKGMDLPFAPDPPIVLREEDDRPQPKYDRDNGKGMAVTVGRVREDPIWDYKFMLLGHNTIRGASGAALLNAELMRVKGLLK